MSTFSEASDIAVIGAGPIGIEAALLARKRGWDVRVYERDSVGAHIAKWSHVRFFSAWELDRSPWGEAEVRQRGVELEPLDEFPTGAEYLERYLKPLAESAALEGRIEEQCRVLEVSRRDALKTDHVGAPARTESPFILHLDAPDGERYACAEYVLDATGAYETPNGLGPGGLRALGERTHNDRIEHYIPDVLGDEREKYRNREIFVLGAGYSAGTTLRDLVRLRAEAPKTRITWCLRDTEQPYELIPDDPLPMRRKLSEFGNRAARGEIAGIEPIAGTVRAVRSTRDDGLRIEGADRESTWRKTADRLVANVGYRPDLELFREMQVHPCWATEGPIDLAASLLAADDGGDCLQHSSEGVEQLTHPEPNFFVVGSKSYGRNSTFLLDVGYQQIEDVLDSIDETKSRP